jgi:type III pantothenate kinase
MQIVIDIGNSNIVYALAKEQQIIATLRKSSKITAKNQIIEHFQNLLDVEQLTKNDITNLVIASVVPNIDGFYKDASLEFFGFVAKFVADLLEPSPLTLKVDNVAEVGDDRIANSLAAINLYSSNLIIVDFGTATTFDVVDTNAAYIGGVIAPGIDLSLQALSNCAAKLPDINFQLPKKIVGRNTRDAMQSGIFYGYLGLIEKIITEIKSKELNQNAKVITTGGFGPLFAKHCKIIDQYDEFLTLQGILAIANINAANKKI